MLTAPSLSRFKSPFISSPLKLPPPPPFFSQKFHQTNRRTNSYPCVRAVDLDQNTVIAITVGVLSVAIGVGIPVFYETQIDNAAKRENTQPCFPCSGSGGQMQILHGCWQCDDRAWRGEKEVSRCINCDGSGGLTCTTCQGSGIQPRYLDRREFKDDD